VRHKIHFIIERDDDLVRLKVLLGIGTLFDQVGDLTMSKEEWEMFKEMLIVGADAKDVPFTIDELPQNEKGKVLYPK